MTLLILITRGFLQEWLSLISCEQFSRILHVTVRRFYTIVPNLLNSPRPIAQGGEGRGEGGRRKRRGGKKKEERGKKKEERGKKKEERGKKKEERREEEIHK